MFDEIAAVRQTMAPLALDGSDNEMLEKVMSSTMSLEAEVADALAAKGEGIDEDAFRAEFFDKREELRDVSALMDLNAGWTGGEWTRLAKKWRNLWYQWNALGQLLGAAEVDGTDPRNSQKAVIWDRLDALDVRLDAATCEALEGGDVRNEVAATDEELHSLREQVDSAYDELRSYLVGLWSKQDHLEKLVGDASESEGA